MNDFDKAILKATELVDQDVKRALIEFSYLINIYPQHLLNFSIFNWWHFYYIFQ